MPTYNLEFVCQGKCKDKDKILKFDITAKDVASAIAAVQDTDCPRCGGKKKLISGFSGDTPQIEKQKEFLRKQAIKEEKERRCTRKAT